MFPKFEGDIVKCNFQITDTSEVLSLNILLKCFCCRLVSSRFFIFLYNFFLNEMHLLSNRTLHISDTFKKAQKPDIEVVKTDIDIEKPDIDKLFQNKNALY